MNVSIRPATTADYPHIRRITRDAYLAAEYFEPDNPHFGVLEDVEHRGKHALIWAAEADDTVVAAVTLTFPGQPYTEIAIERELEFRMLAVDPAWQGSGIGRVLVNRIVNYARAH